MYFMSCPLLVSFDGLSCSDGIITSLWVIRYPIMIRALSLLCSSMSQDSSSSISVTLSHWPYLAITNLAALLWIISILYLSSPWWGLHTVDAYYKRFVLEGRDILGDINRYVAHKQYNTDTGDLIIAMLCNAFSVHARIYTYHNNDVLEVEQKPRQDDAITTIWLSLAGEHYDDCNFVYLFTTFVITNFDDVLMLLYDCVCEWVPL